jgi:membrane protease YdiL (CAAX protease family)
MVLLAARYVPGLTEKAATDPASFALFYVGVGGVLLLRIRKARVDPERLFGPEPTKATLRLATVAIPLGILSLAGFWILFVPLSYAAPDFVRTWAIETAMRHPADTLPVWIAHALIAVIVAPVVEEVLFRGVLMHRWALKWGTRTGVLVSSALFAIGHVELLGHFLFGLAMAALYLRTRSLWVPIAAHALNNFLVSALMLPGIFHPEKPEERMTLATLQSQWWVGLLVLVTGGALLEVYRRRFWKGIDLAGLISGPVPYAWQPAPLPANPD